MTIRTTIRIIVQHPEIKTFIKRLRQAALVAVVLATSACETAPPVQEMSDARQAIAVAKEAGAAQKAAFHLKAAEDYLESAEKALNKQAKAKALDALKASEDSD